MRLSAPVHRARAWFSGLSRFSKKLPQSAEVSAPYFSQFMSADLVEDYIEHRKALSTDPNWRQSGADDPDEYERWTWSDCGITCFKMILVAMGKETASVPLVKLGKEAMTYGAFKTEGEKISPLHYAEFAAFARGKYDLKVRVISALSTHKMKEEVSNGNFVIASVHPSIRRPDSIPPKRGGHLVLVIGYDDERGGFYIHNPSGYQSLKSQERTFVRYDQFSKFFAHRGVVIEK